MALSVLSVADWRRRVQALYAAVRADPDPAAGHARWCSERAGLLATHPASPVPPAGRVTYAGPVVAPYDPDLRFEVALETAEERSLAVPTGTDGVVAFRRVGLVRLAGVGGLDVWWLAGYGGGLFLPIRDSLAGHETYGGGRYVLDTVKGADLGMVGDRLVVDLNFAYNPSCAYDPAWACPLAPEGNVVDAPVRAGELMQL